MYDSGLKFTIHSNHLKVYMCYFILILAFMEASLRFTDSGLTVIYRWAIPIGLLFLATDGIKDIYKVTKWFLIVCIYSILVSVIFYNNVNLFAHLFIAFILYEYFFIEYIAKHSKNFNESFYSFLDMFTLGIFILGFFQSQFNFIFPHIQTRADGLIYLFFWNENELGAAISSVGVLYFFRAVYKREKTAFIKFMIVCVIDYLNDAKLCLIGLVVGAFFIITVYLTRNYVRKRIVVVILRLVILICISFLIWFMLARGVEISFRDYSIDLYRLLFSSIQSILTLTPQGGYGSIQVRTDAIIYGLIELKNSLFFGIGLENSTKMLEMTKYELVTAKSMHNLIFKCITEFGYFTMLVTTLIFKKFYIEAKDYGADKYTILRLAYVLSFLFISSQSSGGILSNYMFWAVTFYVIILKPSKPYGIIEDV